jgi:hypothetical protein
MTDTGQGTVGGAPTKYCDIVMKGGITSGVVYPNAVLALSRRFRFKNIGGTSAGAIAAAATAAAARGDRAKSAERPLAHDPGKVGFEGLETVARRLSTEGFIYSLFQPTPGAGHAYRLLVKLVGKDSVPSKLACFALTLLAAAPIEIAAILVVLLGIGWLAAGWAGVGAAILPSLLCAAIGGTVATALRVAGVARGNMLGLCSGLRAPGSADQGLTEWLHQVLQELSGKPAGEPLTFADLWNADRYDGEPKTDQAVNLQMITTGVSHHEPRTLPFVDTRFWFLREDFDRLFPKSVVDWMVAQGGAGETVGGKSYYRLPADGDLPVLVGMRMSLSFPLLISAVPLYEPEAWAERSAVVADGAAPADATRREKNLGESTDGLAASGGRSQGRVGAFRVCWFSDGGISSNFPIHLFDSPLPLWPTFAIDLVYPKTDDRVAPEKSVFLPPDNNQGWRRTYQSIAAGTGAGEIAGFLFAVVGTMQNWRDLIQSRAPGYRDRIVHVSLDADEGGMNLNMPQAVLDSISGKGTQAGEAFGGFSFANHYWIRWRNLASALQRYTIKVGQSVGSKPKIPGYLEAYATAQSGNPPPVSYKFTSEERRQAAEALLKELAEKGHDWHDLGPDFTQGAPRPLPQMQISPTY